MRRQLNRFWIALAVLPVVAGAALASGAVMFFCRGDAVARVACSCPETQRVPASTNVTGTLSAAPCCDISQADAPSAPPAVEPRAATLLAQDAGLALTPGGAVVSWAPPVRTWPANRLAQPPPPAVPILLGKQSFLI